MRRRHLLWLTAPLALACGGDVIRISFDPKPGQALDYASSISMIIPADMDPMFNNWSEEDRTMRFTMDSYAKLQKKVAKESTWKVGIRRASLSGKIMGDELGAMEKALVGSSATVVLAGNDYKSFNLDRDAGEHVDIVKGMLMMVAAPTSSDLPPSVRVSDTFSSDQLIDGTMVSGKGKVEAVEQVKGVEALRVSMTVTATGVKQATPMLIWIRTADGVALRIKGEMTYSEGLASIPMRIEMDLK